MKIAVVHNRRTTGVIGAFGQKCPEKYSARTVLDVVQALEEFGHKALLCEGDKTLLAALENFMPPDAEGPAAGLVFNMAYGIQGDCRYTHVPAMLEMAGVPYTGSSPLGHALALDKVITKDLIRLAGLPTPNYRVMRRPGDSHDGLHFPVVVKPRHESTSFGLELVHVPRELGDAVERVLVNYQQDALVEEYVEGREVCVALLGNEEMEFLPLVEQDFGDRQARLVTWEDKVKRAPIEARKICPAAVAGPLAESLMSIAHATFRACHCRDYARVDIRIDEQGNPYVLEINSMASLGRTGSYTLAALTAGYSFPALVNRIVDLAHRRYFSTPASRDSLEIRAMFHSAAY